MYNKALKACNYTYFREYHPTIENICKPNSENPNLYTLSGDIVIKREKKPFINKTSLANADLVLMQMSRVFDMAPSFYWFPTLYCYYEGVQDIWVKLISKAYCQQILPLFGVNTINELKLCVEKCVFDEKIRHSGAWDSAPVILNNITLDKIATLP